MKELDEELAQEAADRLRRKRAREAFEEERRHNIHCTVAWLAVFYFPVLSISFMGLAGWMASQPNTIFFSEYGVIGMWLTGLVTIALSVYATGVCFRSW